MSSQQGLPTIAGLTPPVSPFLPAVLSHIRGHTSLATVNHSIRAVYFSLLLAKKLPSFSAAVSSSLINLETVSLALLMHDLGWATTKELLSKDKRFEVDGADLAVQFIEDQQQIQTAESATGQKAGWDKARLELLWTAVALHTTPSIAHHHPNPTVALVQLSILCDFFGPNLPPPLPKETVTVDEYRAIVKEFPRAGFKEDLVQIMCGLCREKKETTFDNFVSSFGRRLGLDGNGAGAEEYTKEWEERDLADTLLAALDACAAYEK
ncbi:hypothetical protein GJ744_003369 [Endocarpon pusillum]|uniref:HD domain-containing protein n=1 Tax=Endocarpon pusillum TaxID=364733 RepID=A0A8H7AAT0_9EURO|nr:hypothetical protein GJ744_003369 [Endocarpon pusillum]